MQTRACRWRRRIACELVTIGACVGLAEADIA
jgi:hypothetical protein